MGKLGAGWPADVGTISMHCQLLLGVPISYIHFLMNCFIICAGEFLILQIFDVTRHLLDSGILTVFNHQQLLVFQSCPFGWCAFCRESTWSWKKRGFSKHFLGIFCQDWMVLFGNCSALSGRRARRGRCWRNPTEHKGQPLLRCQKEGVCVPREGCCSTGWSLLCQTWPVLIPWLMSVLLGFGGFCLGGVQYSDFQCPGVLLWSLLQASVELPRQKTPSFFSFICVLDTSLSAQLTNCYQDFV